MSESMRSFIAFDLQDEAVLNRLSLIQQLLIETGADLKLVETQNIHVTVRFLGEISQSTMEKVFEAMKKVKFTPFNIQIRGLGVFPSLNYPRVVWAGMTEGVEQLKSIFSQLEPQMRALGFEPDTHGFSPHLTIARVRSGANKQRLAEVVSKETDYDFGPIKANCLRLKKSQLSPRGPTYSTLKEFCPTQEQK
jgi:RNA 2',3'-cyclic 3'-phosphodiesterase